MMRDECSCISQLTQNYELCDFALTLINFALVMLNDKTNDCSNIIGCLKAYKNSRRVNLDSFIFFSSNFFNAQISVIVEAIDTKFVIQLTVNLYYKFSLPRPIIGFY